jgi:hypothetical protein
MVLTGSCLCGAIAFRYEGPRPETSACWCGQCRKQSGHAFSAAGATTADLAITGTPRWYHSSPAARRGFCPTCGATLFWQAEGSDQIAFSLGALDAPTGLSLDAHIFTADAPDYAPLPADGVPRS